MARKKKGGDNFEPEPDYDHDFTYNKVISINDITGKKLVKK